MNTQGVISINPTCTPAGIHIPKEILNTPKIAKKPISALKQTAKMLLGVTTSTSDSRRQWTFRLVLGSILMCFGLLFLHSEFISGPEYVMPGICTAMIAGGAFIACGFLTRIVSFGLAIILTMFACHISLATMTGYAILVCIGACMAGIITASGRYSLDTLIYNGMFRRG